MLSDRETIKPTAILNAVIITAETTPVNTEKVRHGSSRFLK